ncbi:MAG: hypothetical protein M1820_002267 [Bogoriella megaspora]|nr:MAG: hypothetical protein M1820_002267 [Bogoriella megaspora]
MATTPTEHLPYSANALMVSPPHQSEIVAAPQPMSLSDVMAANGTRRLADSPDYFARPLLEGFQNFSRPRKDSDPLSPGAGLGLPLRMSAIHGRGQDQSVKSPPLKQEERVQAHTDEKSKKPLQTRTRRMSFYDAKEQKAAETKANSKTTGQARRASTVGAGALTDTQHTKRHSGVSTIYDRLDQDKISIRLPWTMWMNSRWKNHFVATMGEFVGTTMFLFFAFAGTQVANVGAKEAAGSNTTTNASTGFNTSVLLYISLSFAFSLMVNVWIFFRISGGLFNPAVTLALLLTGSMGKLRAICLFLSQLTASIAASGLVDAMFPTQLNVRTTLSSGTSLVRGVSIEAFITFELVFCILMLAKEKHRATFIAPVGIGLALFIAQLVGVFYTGGSGNPARSFGPCVVTNRWDKEHWIYWVGPFIGALIAVGFYKFIKVLEYEMANPGQDADDWNDPTKNPNHELRERQRDLTSKVLHSLGFEHPTAGSSEDVEKGAENSAAKGTQPKGHEEPRHKSESSAQQKLHGFIPGRSGPS